MARPAKHIAEAPTNLVAEEESLVTIQRLTTRVDRLEKALCTLLDTDRPIARMDARTIMQEVIDNAPPQPY
jgi:hypothetical protein